MQEVNFNSVNLSKSVDRMIEQLVELGQVATCATNSRRRMQTRGAPGEGVEARCLTGVRCPRAIRDEYVTRGARTGSGREAGGS